jgi:hypothetical protein
MRARRICGNISWNEQVLEGITGEGEIVHDRTGRGEGKSVGAVMRRSWGESIRRANVS